MYSVGPPKPSSVGSTSTSTTIAERDAGRDQERALAHALGELAAGDEPDRAVHLTASRKRSVNVGARREVRDAAGGAGGVEDRVGVGALEDVPFGPRSDLAPGRRAGRRDELVDRAAGRPTQAAVLDDRHGLAQPLDELELVAGEDDRHAGRGVFGQDAAETSTPTGSSPENGSSSTSSSGSCTSAAASWTRCWLPSESSSTRSSARSLEPEALDPAVRGGLGPRRRRAATRSRRAGRARASSGTGRAPPACSRSACGRRRRPARRSSAPRRGRRRARRG